MPVRYGPPHPRVRVEDSPSPVYGAALLMRLGVTTLRGSNPRSSAAPRLCPEHLWTGPDPWNGQRLQFGLQLRSSLAPRRLAHPLARVPHLERGHVGVSLGCRHPGVAKHLLNDADVHTLLDQQRRGRVPGIVKSGAAACTGVSRSGTWSVGPRRPYPAVGSGSASAAAARPTCRIDSRAACAAAVAWSVRPVISVMACSSAAVWATRSRYLSFMFDIRSASCKSRNADLAPSTSAA